MSAAKLKFQRVLLRLSREALLGEEPYGIDARALNRVAEEVSSLSAVAVEVPLVIGDGKIFRGTDLYKGGMECVTAAYRHARDGHERARVAGFARASWHGGSSDVGREYQRSL